MWLFDLKSQSTKECVSNATAVEKRSKKAERVLLSAKILSPRTVFTQNTASSPRALELNWPIKQPHEYKKQKKNILRSFREDIKKLI